MRAKKVAILESRLGAQLADLVAQRGGVPFHAPALAELPDLDPGAIGALLRSLEERPGHAAARRADRRARARRDGRGGVHQRGAGEKPVRGGRAARMERGAARRAQPHAGRLDRPGGVVGAARGQGQGRPRVEPAETGSLVVRSGFGAVVRSFVLVFLFASQALAQSYPSRPVKLVVGFAPGGAADFVARVFADPLSRALGAPIVVENKPGAGSSIAAESVAKAAPDGYTVLIASPSSILVNPLLNPNPGFQPLRDLAPVSKLSASPLVVAVNPGGGVSSLRELIDHAQKNPGELNFASSGNGAAPHLAAVLFQRLAGVEMVHVPYKGGGPAVQSVLAGETQLSFATPPSVLPLVNAGRLRALAVTSRERTPLVPGVPGMAEAGLPDYEISFWYGFFVPAGTPAEVVKRLFDATGVVLQNAELNRALAKEETEASGSRSTQHFAAFLAEDTLLWTRLVKDSGAKTE